MKIKKTIPIAKLQKEAITKNVSVYLLIKRFLNYRETEGKDHDRNCLNCKAVKRVPYEVNTIAGKVIEKIHQCVRIGIIKDYYTDVDKKHICNIYKRSYIINKK